MSKSLRILLLCAFTLCWHSSVFAFKLTLVTPDGGSITLDLPDDSSLEFLHEQALEHAGSEFLGFRLVTDNDDLLGEEGPLPNEQVGEDSIVRMLDPNEIPGYGIRDYYEPMSESQLETLHYLIDTLSSKPVPLLLLLQGELDRRGHELDEVHPFRVFTTIFTDEKLKVGIRNMKKKKRVWNEWVDGIADSLNSAAERENLTLEMAEDMSEQIDLGIEHYWKHVENQDRKRFMDTLATRVPRQGGGGNRYD